MSLENENPGLGKRMLGGVEVGLGLVPGPIITTGLILLKQYPEAAATGVATVTALVDGLRRMHQGGKIEQEAEDKRMTPPTS